MPNTSPQSKYWIATINNFTPDDVLRVRRLGRTCSYAIFGREGRGATPHLQCYFELHTRCRRSRISKQLNGRGHIQTRAKGATGEDNKKYCSKEGDFEEFGKLTKKKQGNRTDLEEIKERIEKGASDLYIATTSFSQWVYHRKAFNEYRRLVNGSGGLRRDLRVVVLVGPTGTGKSGICYHHWPDLFAVPDPRCEWFDGYVGQSVVLFDDFRGGGVRGNWLLRLLDIYPLQVPVKGSYVTWIPRLILLTSNVAPPFGLVDFDVADPLRRRIHSVINMNEHIDFNNNEILDSYKKIILP